jgi:hypothetical protein
MFTRTFWLKAAERAVKSAAQALIGLWFGDAAFNAWDADWAKARGVAAGAVVLSLLSSVATAGVGQKDSPSAVGE